MIQRALIAEWRSVAPWPLDSQVEQDLVLSRALVEIFSDPVLSQAFTLRGGMALHKMAMPPAARYSEDIDLVQRAAGPIGPALDALRARLDPWLGAPRRKAGEGGVTLAYRFDSEVPPVTPLRVKVEINTREHFTEFGLVQRDFRIESRWFAGEAKVVTYTVEELLGTKLRALYQRKRGRDLFDLDLAMRKLPDLDPSRIVQCFAAYMKHEGASVSRAEFEANLAEKAGDPAFMEDLRALIVGSAIPFDASAALARVLATLVARLPGDSWKGHPGGT